MNAQAAWEKHHEKDAKTRETWINGYEIGFKSAGTEHDKMLARAVMREQIKNDLLRELTKLMGRIEELEAQLAEARK